MNSGNLTSNHLYLDLGLKRKALGAQGSSSCRPGSILIKSGMVYMIKRHIRNTHETNAALGCT
ncbi:hypothetical protein HanIR_Chr09g0406021 [Helianthus annuus]|nr:hypothetical protein HanIR_Chr09g0406021 [Helianthus annuus]